MVSKIKLQAGFPIILDNAKDLGKYGLRRNMKGFANNVVTIPKQGEYVYFMPDGLREVFVIEANRVYVDEERLEELKQLGEIDTDEMSS